MGRRRRSLRRRAPGAYLAPAQQDRAESQQARLHPDQAWCRLQVQRQGELPRRSGTDGAGGMSMRPVGLGPLVFALSFPLSRRRAIPGGPPYTSSPGEAMLGPAVTVFTVFVLVALPHK